MGVDASHRWGTKITALLSNSTGIPLSRGETNFEKEREVRNCTTAGHQKFTIKWKSGQVDLSSSFSHCSFAEMHMPQISAEPRSLGCVHSNHSKPRKQVFAKVCILTPNGRKYSKGALQNRKVITLLYVERSSAGLGTWESTSVVREKRHAMWKTFYTSWRPEKTQESPWRQETIYLQPLQEIQSRWEVKKAPRNPHLKNLQQVE